MAASSSLNPHCSSALDAVRAQADLRECGELVGQRQRRRQRLARGDHAVGQPQGESLRRRHGASGEDQVHGPPVPDDARQADGAEVAQRHAEAAAEHSEDGVLGGDTQVAPEGQLNAPGHGVALDGGDDRLAQRQPRRSHRAGPVVGDGPAIPLGHRFEVGAGAEGCAGPREDGHGTVVVLVEGHEGLTQLVGAQAVDGIAALGPVDRDHRHWSVVLDEDGVGPVRAVGLC